MNEMDSYLIYPKLNLSKRMQQAMVCLYLLCNAFIVVPNQVWSIDITYIPIRHGFLYLTAVIDFSKENGIRQSMNGKSCQADNITIERRFRSFKYEESYMKICEIVSRSDGGIILNI